METPAILCDWIFQTGQGRCSEWVPNSFEGWIAVRRDGGKFWQCAEVSWQPNCVCYIGGCLWAGRFAVQSRGEQRRDRGRRQGNGSNRASCTTYLVIWSFMLILISPPPLPSLLFPPFSPLPSLPFSSPSPPQKGDGTANPSSPLPLHASLPVVTASTAVLPKPCGWPCQTRCKKEVHQ